MATVNANIGAISGEIIATDVTFEEYLEKYAANFCEFVAGNVIKMSPASLHHHNLITSYLFMHLAAYFELKPIGKVIPQPFVMQIADMNLAREPDLFVVLNTNSGNLTATYMDGPADICVEVVSPESVRRDHGEKFEEYEKARVGEYWIVDPLRKESRFYRLDENKVYIPFDEDADANYLTPALPGFVLHVPTLWQEQLPGPVAIGQAVQVMLTP